MLTVLNIALINLLLSSDNVIVIALFSANIKKRRRMFGLFASMVASVLLQLGILFVVAFLFRFTFLQALFGVLICYMAFHLFGSKKSDVKNLKTSSIWAKIAKIVFANLMMSFENEATLITISHGNIWIAWMGILVTAPIIFFGSHLIVWLLEKFDFILYLGAVILFKIGIDLIFTLPALQPFTRILPWGLAAVFFLYVGYRYTRSKWPHIDRERAR